MGGVANSIVGAVTQPFENIGNAVEKVFTDPTSLTLGDAVTLAVPVTGGLVRDAIDNPDHAAVQAVAVGGAVAGSALLGGSTTVAGAAAPGTILPPAAEILATPVGASLVPTTAAAAAGGGGGGFLSTLGATSLATTLTGIGQKAQGLVAAIPGATSFLSGIPGLSSLATPARAAEAPNGFTAALGVNEEAPAPTPNDQLKSLVIGTVIVAAPLGGIAWLAWKAYRRSRRA